MLYWKQPNQTNAVTLQILQARIKFNSLLLIFLVFCVPNVHSQTIEGIDVSKWQGTIDWGQVKDSGKVFAYARATEGLADTDHTFKTNMTKGLEAGMVMGAYSFGRPNVNALEAARHFADVADSFIGPGFLPPVIDIETTEGLPSSIVSKWVQDWISEVRRLTGITPMIYTGGYFASDFDQSLSVYPLWIAQWGASTPSVLAIWDDWLFWQYAGNGRVAGIVGNVALNVFHGDSLAFDSLIRVSTTSNAALYKPQEFAVFPNPFVERIGISTSIGGNYSIKLIDMTGRVVYESLAQGSTDVQTTTLSNGMYICQLSTQKGVVIRKTLLKTR